MARGYPKFTATLIAVLAGSFAASQNAAIGANRAGVAAAVVGDVAVTATKAATLDRRTAISGMDMFLGDRVESKAKSRMQILLLDETVFTIGPRSDLVIDKFVYDPGANAGELTASFTKGLFRYVSGKLAKSHPQNIRIRVPDAVIGIRGTTMFGITDSQSGGVFYGLLGPGRGNNADLADGGFTYQGTGNGDNGLTRNVSRAGYGMLVKGGVPGLVIRTPQHLMTLLQSQLTSGPGGGPSARSGTQSQGGDQGGAESATESSGQMGAQVNAAAAQLGVVLDTDQAADEAVEAGTEGGTSDDNPATSSRVNNSIQVAENVGSGSLPFGVDIPYAVEMVWSNISDLDLHVNGPNMDGSTRFHVYFSNRGSFTSAPYALLDNDRTGIGGSEVIGLSNLFSGDGQYEARVFNFGDSSSGSTSLSNSANLVMRLIKNGRISRGSNGSAIVNGTVKATVNAVTGQSGNTFFGFKFNASGTPTVVGTFENSTSSASVGAD